MEHETSRRAVIAGVDRAAAEGRTGGRPPALSPEKIEAVRGFPGKRRVGQLGRQDLRGE